MELINYIRLFRRWMWLIVLVAFVAGSLNFISRATRPTLYRTHATISIGNYLQSPNPDSYDIYIGVELVQTYAHLVRTYDVLSGVVEALDLPFSPEAINGLLDIRIVTNTSLLQIGITHTDPVLAADIANEVAYQLILQSPTNLTADQQEQVNILNDQIAAQTLELQALRGQLQELDAIIARTSISLDDHTAEREQRSTLIDQINEASANIAQFSNTVATFQQRSNSIELVEAARIPTISIRSNLFSSVFVSAFVAGAFMFACALVYEYLNDTFRSADEVVSTLNLPVLGVISRFGKKNEDYHSRLLTNLPAFSPLSEEFRTLRTNILYTVRNTERIFIVSSALPEEGKTLTSANLAASIAVSGQRVLLIDADLRRPRVHEVFGIKNNIGLSNLLTLQLNVEQVQEDTTILNDEELQNFHDTDANREAWEEAIQQTNIPTLDVMTSGFYPVNPSELLGSVLMKHWIERIYASKKYDVIIFDSPPILAVADGIGLSALLAAKVILVVQARQTRRNAAIQAKERFENVHVDVVGVVLNNANLRDETYYGYGYSYYYAPQPSDEN
jgi:Mrp family chromosome partitioning ATPase/capsular polysaccharide biosynthesis protein